MSKCNWCEKENCKNYDHEIQFDKWGLRKILHEFANAMETKMSEKDKRGYTYNDKSLDFLVNHLKEERSEVDFELIDLPSFEIYEELVDEAIMCMLVRNKIRNLKKEDLNSNKK